MLIYFHLQTLLSDNNKLINWPLVSVRNTQLMLTKTYIYIYIYIYMYITRKRVNRQLIWGPDYLIINVFDLPNWSGGRVYIIKGDLLIEHLLKYLFEADSQTEAFTVLTIELIPKLITNFNISLTWIGSIVHQYVPCGIGELVLRLLFSYPIFEETKKSCFVVNTNEFKFFWYAINFCLIKRES